MDRVICTNNTLRDYWKEIGWPGDPLHVGCIYTVRGITNKGGYLLFEIRSYTMRENGTEVGYHTRHFCPVQDTDLDIFRSIVKSVLEPVA